MASDPVRGPHESVLVAEIVSLLQPHATGVYVDGTLGAGGHTAALLEAGAGRVIGVDRDLNALAIAKARLEASGRVEFVHADYRNLPGVLRERGLTAVDGVLVDLGVSSMQLDDPARGFSFKHDGPLDMRMDPSTGQTAAEWLATVEESELADVIYRFGEERHSRRVARAIVRARETAPLQTTAQLASVVRRAAGGRGWQRLDPATRTFQAIRVHVNRELDGLEQFLDDAVSVLVPGGRFAVIAFHSLEDRVVKHTFRRMSGSDSPAAALLTRRPVVPGDDEAARNPRSRSARLRAVERLT